MKSSHFVHFHQKVDMHVCAVSHRDRCCLLTVVHPWSILRFFSILWSYPRTQASLHSWQWSLAIKSVTPPLRDIDLLSASAQKTVCLGCHGTVMGKFQFGLSWRSDEQFQIWVVRQSDGQIPLWVFHGGVMANPNLGCRGVVMGKSQLWLGFKSWCEDIWRFHLMYGHLIWNVGIQFAIWFEYFVILFDE